MLSPHYLTFSTTQQRRSNQKCCFHTTGRVWLVFENCKRNLIFRIFLTNQFLSIFVPSKTKHQDSIICASCVRVVRRRKRFCSYSYTIWKTTRGEKWASDSFWRGPPSSRSITLILLGSAAAIYCTVLAFILQQTTKVKDFEVDKPLINTYISIHYNERQ